MKSLGGVPHPVGGDPAASIRPALVLILGVVLAVLLAPPALAAQVEAQPLGAQTLRAHWHVFVAYLLAWALVFGWLVSVARRLARVERSLEE